VPDWIARRLYASLGAVDAADVLRELNTPAESIIRWNPLGGDRHLLEERLPAGARRCDPPFDDAYRLDGPFALEDSEIWHEGRAMAQSRASMLPVLALDPQPGERILDLCAAPGAKSMFLASRVGDSGHVTSVELHAARAEGLRELATRMHATLTVVSGDAREVALEGPYDAVLVDPPCSGLGVLGTRPDARWRRREESVEALQVLQGGLLSRALQEVRPGGRVVYSTCTLLPEENELVIGASGADLMDLRHVAPDLAHPELIGALRTLPGRDGTDGFFVAGLRPTTTG
jgi:16S rRNA (cytosine967-C5)-methyltransferase